MGGPWGSLHFYGGTGSQNGQDRSVLAYGRVAVCIQLGSVSTYGRGQCPQTVEVNVRIRSGPGPNTVGSRSAYSRDQCPHTVWLVSTYGRVQVCIQSVGHDTATSSY